MRGEPGIREIRRLFREVCVLHAWVSDYVSGLELSSGDELSLELSWFIGYGGIENAEKPPDLETARIEGKLRVMSFLGNIGLTERLVNSFLLVLCGKGDSLM